MNIAILYLLLVIEATAQEVAQGPFQFSANGTNGCHEACTILVDRFGEGQKAFYREPQSLFTGYDGYYSLRHLDAVPTCLITPDSARDVSDALKVIIQHSCKFAVKSGGHSMFPGGASINNGVVFDLRYLNQLGISEDKTTAFVGPGNRWGAVYSFLDPMNLTVVGGRVSGVGVGGYLLGGGISYISRKHGWGCDNVRNYEVVLANGSVTNINQKSDPDLYWALRGGGNNFGIVTRFDLETYPLEPMWGGSNVLLLSDVHNHLAALEIARSFSWSMSWAIETASEAINRVTCRIGYCTSLGTFAELLESHIIDTEPDLDAQTYLALTILPRLNLYAVFLQFTHGQGLDASPSFAELKQLKSLYSSNRLSVNSDLVMELENFHYRGARVSWEPITTKVNSALMKEIMRIFLLEIEPIRNLKGFRASLPFQLITKEEISHFSKNGGNPLGITEEDGPLFLITVCLYWKNPQDDEIVLQAQTNIINKSVALAKQIGLYHPYIFQNYARKDQDVFAGYGLGNRKRLQEIQKRYDPDGVFSRLQPGYFKV